MPQKGRLRIYGHGEVEVELVATYLAELRHAYESIVVFEATIDGMRRASREFPFPVYAFGFQFGWPLATRRGTRYVREWPPSADEVATFVPASEQLVLSAVTLSSPGFWEFVGKLNPLEVLRQYLNDRHERRKDHEYRESAEKRRLALENLRLENSVLSDRVRLARELGATDSDLAPLLNALVLKPLLALDRYQDRGLIENAEFSRGEDEKRG